jgi:uncharacterized protein YggE
MTVFLKNLILATATATLCCAAQVFAADGFKASVTVSKRIPADILIVRFHLIERSLSNAQSRLREEEARIRRELTDTGATIKSWTSAVSIVNAGFSTSTFNFVSPGNAEPQAIDARRDVVVQILAVKDAENVAAVLTRNGIRHAVQFTWTSSTIDQAREALQLEAIDLTVKKAHDYAKKAGGKAGPIIDLTVRDGAGSAAANSTTSATASSGMASVTLPLTGTFLYAPIDQLIEDDTGRHIVIATAASVTLAARTD